MRNRSAAGKRNAQHRAATLADDLREQIERRSAAQYARWTTRGREPMWMRVKRAMSAAPMVRVGRVR
jgi:hypothetical protein